MNAVATPEQSALAAASETGKWHASVIERTRYWTPDLLSFRIARPHGFHFVPGHYARLGLGDTAGEALWRPFSMVSGPADDHLEFIAALIPGGAFSERLRRRKEGDAIFVEKLSLGFLTLDQLAPGNDLWMLASGTGLGPFVSIMQDPATWKSFDRLILVHSVRRADELAYREEIAELRASHATGSATLRSIPVVTRENATGALHARIPQLMTDGRLEQEAGVPLDVEHSRVMVCGNPDLTWEMRALLVAKGFQTARRGMRGQMAFEKYW
jgi:ferredoxin--NADP+ reductase